MTYCSINWQRFFWKILVFPSMFKQLLQCICLRPKHCPQCKTGLSLEISHVSCIFLQEQSSAHNHYPTPNCYTILYKNHHMAQEEQVIPNHHSSAKPSIHYLHNVYSQLCFPTMNISISLLLRASTHGWFLCRVRNRYICNFLCTTSFQLITLIYLFLCFP